MDLIVKMKFGSHLYGTDTENSDIDYKVLRREMMKKKIGLMILMKKYIPFTILSN